MAELGHSFVSANKSTQWGLNADQGAGANAGSLDEMMFVANSSLSELVWSPSKGFHVKCADCSVLDKNSLLWCSDSGNMMFLSQSIKGKEIENDGTVNEENLGSFQLPPNPENEFHITETLVGSSEGCVGVTPLNETSCHEENWRLCGITDPVTTKFSIVKVDNDRVDKSTKEDMAICSHSDTQKGADVNKKGTVSNATLHDNAPTQDQDNMRSAGSSSNRLEESRPDLALVETEHVDLTRGVSSDQKSGDIGGGNNQASDSADVLVSKMKQYDLSRRSKLVQSLDVKHVEPISVFEENRGNKMSYLEKRESMAENDIKPLEMEDKLCCRSPLAEVGMTLALQPEVEERHSPENNVTWIESSWNEKGSSLKRRNGKEKPFSDTELNAIISNDEDRSHESVESSNSGQFFSNGKRARKFEHQLAFENKKIKRNQNEAPCSSSFIGQDSSFINWISNMIKGFSKFDSDVTPFLALPAEPSHHQHGIHDTLLVPHDKNRDPLSRRTGFQNIFQALYCPREKLQNKIKCSLDQQTEAEGSKELEATNKMPYHNASSHAACNEENSGLCKHTHVCMSTLPKVCPPRVLSAEENPNKLCNMAGDSKIGQCSSDSYFKNNSGSHEEKVAMIHGSIDPNKFSISAANKSPAESLWVTRFSPKVSMPMLNSLQCHQDQDGTPEGFTDCKRLLPIPHNLILSLKERFNSEDSREPSMKDPMNAVSRTVQYCSMSPTGSCGSTRTKIQADQKFRSKLNPILPSQRFNSSEAMASVFARRLDALKHVSPPKASDDASPAGVLCFYCGKKGHLLRDCTDIIESEFKDLLKEGNMYDGFEEASCLCIRCFQFSHWAVACPYSFSRKQSCQNGNASFHGGESSETSQDKPQNQNLPVDACTVSLGENSRLNTEFMAHTNKIGGTIILDGSCSNYQPNKRGLLEEDYHKGMSWKGTPQELILNRKHAVLSSKVTGLKESQIMPYCGKPMPSIPREAFEIIRRLRLSRSDILKWMKSPNSSFSLDGFFLRLRLGKWEEGLGGTGYHVGCISGASPESSSGKFKLPISVDIGGLICAVDCRYVSNHDFNEEELKVWWFANLKGPRKLPRIEELSMKLVEKEKCGF